MAMMEKVRKAPKAVERLARKARVEKEVAKGDLMVEARANQPRRKEKTWEEAGWIDYSQQPDNRFGDAENQV